MFGGPQRYKIEPGIEYLCCMLGEWTSRHRTGQGGGGGSWSSSNARLCRRWSESKHPCCASLSMICSLCSVGGAIPDSTGRKAIGIGCKHPVIVCMVSYKATSSLHQTGTAYSAAQ